VESSVLLTGAHRYLRFYSTPLGRAVLSREVALVKSELADHEPVLDVGCGPGAFEQLSGMRMVGLDVDRKMLELASPDAHCTFMQGAAEHLPFREGSFGAVLFITSLEFVHDVEATLTEACRVLEVEGRLLALVLNPLSDYFKEGARRGGYFARAKASPEDVMRSAVAHFELEGSYWLGISGQEVFDSDNPKEASLCVIKGIKST